MKHIAQILVFTLLSLATGVTGSLFAQSADQCFDKGTDLFIEKRFQEAEEMLNTCLRIDPQYAEAWRLLGKIRTEQAKFKEAIAFHKKAIKLQPRNPEYLTLLAWNWQQLRKAKTAMRFYKKATRADSNYHHAWLYGGRLLQQQQRYVESLHWADEAIRTNSLSSEGYTLYGIGLLLTEDEIEAFNLFETALRLDPKDAEAMLYDAIALESFGEDAKALRMMTQAGIFNPADTILQLHRVRLASKPGSGADDNTNAFVDMILQTVPEARVHLALNCVHKDWKEADRLLQSVKEFTVSNSLAQEIEGLVIFYQGEYLKSMAKHRNVLKMKEPRPDLEFLKYYCRVQDDNYFNKGTRKYSCDKNEHPFMLSTPVNNR